MTRWWVEATTPPTAPRVDGERRGGSAEASWATAAQEGARTIARAAAPSQWRGVATELAWTSLHVTLYPWGLLDEHLRPGGVWSHCRTATLAPDERSLVVSDMDASTVPVVLVHGIIDNRSIFTVLGRALRRRGHGAVHAVNYSPSLVLAGDIRGAAADLAAHIEHLCAATGQDRVHVVGHSLGGLIARYYVQRLGGDRRVETLVTLGTPHHGTVLAHLLPGTRLLAQLRPDSDVLREMAAPAADCRTRFLVVWSRMDELIVPQENAQLVHDDLDVRHVALDHVGHMALTLDAHTVHAVVQALAHHEEPAPAASRAG